MRPLRLLIPALFSLSVICNASIPEPRFEVQEIDKQVQIGYGIAISDVNADGRLDIILADQHSVQWYENPSWSRHLIVENVTDRDNVCIAAQDVDGDGKAEIAIGAQWNPNETSDPEKSGGVFYLIPPSDRRGLWEAVKLHHEPTVHRMHWIQSPDGVWDLIVKPLHGRGNKNNSGDGSKVFAYRMPPNPKSPWTTTLVSDFTHASHNFHPVRWDGTTGHSLLTAAKEGVFKFTLTKGAWSYSKLSDVWTGEVRDGKLPDGSRFFATIEPMHGSTVAFYTQSTNPGEPWSRNVLDEGLKDGHAVVVNDFLALGSDQIIAGWRGMNPKGTPGVRMYTPPMKAGGEWRLTEISGEAVAIEDMKAADLDGDGLPDLVLAGRQTQNLRILWNKTKK